MTVARVLVIEDETPIREELVDWLTFEEYPVFVATNGREGVELAIKERPDLIICDISMPEMNGHEVLIDIRSNPHLFDVIFIFLTASVNRATRRKGMELGADDYITKPFTHAELMNAVQSQLKKKVSREREAQTQLDLMQLSLQSEREQRILRSRLVGMFSHDFRTPLSLIMMSASLIRNYEDRFSAERKQEKLDQIIHSSKQLVHMLDDLLVTVEMGSDKFRYRPEILNVSERTERIVHDFQDIHYETHQILFASTIEQSVRLDPKLMRQIVTNLLSNAIKYSPTGSTVWVNLAFIDGMVELTVRDEGIGIPPESLPHLFEPFHRADNIKTIRGTGLGLAIVRQAVDYCHGRVEVNSVVGSGTTFRVLFPDEGAA